MKFKLALLVLLSAFFAESDAQAAYTRPASFVIPPAFQDARDFHEGLAAVKSNDRWGYIDYLGRIAIPFVHRVPEAGDFADGFAFVGDHYIDTEGLPAFVRVDPDTDERTERFFANGLPFSQGMAAVQVGGRWGYIDMMGNYLIAPVFERAGSFVDGLAPARLNGLWGYVDSRGRWVIEPKFTRARDFHEGLAAVYSNGRWGFINKEGKFAIRPQYVEAGDFVDGVAPVRHRTTYRGWEFIGHWNNKVIPRRYNNAGNFGDGLAPVTGDTRWGFVNIRGEWEIASQYEDARTFSEGLAAVKVENKWGYIRQ